MDNIIFNEMCDKADRDGENEVNLDTSKDGNRKCKRSLKLLRGNERDLKLDIEAAYNYAEKSDHYQVSTPNHMKVSRSLKEQSVSFEFQMIFWLLFKPELIGSVYRLKLEIDSGVYGQSPSM